MRVAASSDRARISRGLRRAAQNPMARDIDELKRKYPGRGETRHCYDLTSDTRVFSNQKTASNKTRTIKGLLTGREIVIPDTKSGYYEGRGDALATVRKFGVIAPSTNTIVEYDFWRMLMKNDVAGVGLHQGHILIRMAKWSTDDELMEFLCQLRVEIDHAIDRCMTAEPEYLVMGMSAETFYGGWEGNIEFRAHIEERTNLRVATGAEACKYALEKFGAKRIACVTPYMPVMDKQVAAFFEEIGSECRPDSHDSQDSHSGRPEMHRAMAHAPHRAPLDAPATTLTLLHTPSHSFTLLLRQSQKRAFASLQMCHDRLWHRHS